jgi:hypothetical protein
LIGRCLNLTQQEIWGYHVWTFRRDKQTFSTVVDQESYNLDEEVDEIALLRQTSTPLKLLQVPDEIFYELNPSPEDDGSGTPRYYRLWEETGFSTNLAAADTVYVSSSSASDSSTFTVRIVGRNSSGEVVGETLTLNGTSSVTSTTTWAANGLMQISKSGQTTGTITCYRTTGATVLSELAPEESAPRFKRISLYPIPSAVVTMYLEYYKRIRLLVHDTDVPMIDSKWNWLLIEGTLAKVWQYKQNAAYSELSYRRYERGLLLMRQQDERRMDYIPHLRARTDVTDVVKRFNDSVGTNFPSYGVGY